MPPGSYQPFPGQQYPTANPPRLASPNTGRPQPRANDALVGTPPGQPKFRAQMDELPSARPEPLRMPSPAELGLGPRGKPAEIDWSDVRQRLHRLDVTSFHLQKLPDGGFRFSCVVPTQAGARKVEAESVGEADAIDQALGRAEALK